MSDDLNDPLIRIKDLGKTYHRGDQTISVLEGVDLAVQSGEFIALMGLAD